jgi:hypothetical protein
MGANRNVNGINAHNVNGVVELRRDSKFMKIKSFYDKKSRRKIMDDMRVEIKNLPGEFSLHIKLND